MEKQFDVIIIGAGAAGLSCAIELLKENKKILILEARDRVGGRGFTKPSAHNVPSEMGAEFIHGAPPSILSEIQKMNLTFYDVQDLHHHFQKGKLKWDPHFWDGLQKMMARIPQAIKNKDQSVADFLKRQKQTRSQKQLFKAFVEGFHSADTDIMGAAGLYEAEEASSEDSLGGVELFRLQEGYTHFFERVLQAHSSLRDHLLLNHRVTELHTQKNHVAISCENQNTKKNHTFSAARVVVTLPLAILKSSLQGGADLKWTPGPPQGLQDVLNSMEMGHVQKIVFYFKTRFWEKNFKKGPAFLHAEAGTYFPTWWTTSPMRSTQWTAWQGGPQAFEMTSWSHAKKISVALESFSKLISKPVSYLENQMIDRFHHDWFQDPYSRGAYSYIRTGGVEKSKKIRQVFGKRFIFAGEATAVGAARGTIHGAWDSGVRAARQVCRQK